jgi:hypothetical protein
MLTSAASVRHSSRGMTTLILAQHVGLMSVLYYELHKLFLAPHDASVFVAYSLKHPTSVQVDVLRNPASHVLNLTRVPRTLVEILHEQWRTVVLTWVLMTSNVTVRGHSPGMIIPTPV